MGLKDWKVTFEQNNRISTDTVTASSIYSAISLVARPERVIIGCVHIPKQRAYIGVDLSNGYDFSSSYGL